ncbi:hypothetical protein BC332_20977 [Capsicum chinense]|nr:hypothetical protein BC332_20977 [Capsicum chinense]
MENECNIFPRKLHYDISMSKRTRKKLVNANVNVEQEEKGVISNKEKEEDDDKRSLKQLIEGRGTSLGHHFTEEERQLQMVVKPPENGMKFKQMVSRYAKVLSHMIKLKRKKPAGYRLKMQVHNKP